MEKRMMGPKPEKTTFCSKRSALGGSGAEGEGGAEGAGAAGLEYLSSSGCSSLGNAEKSGELCRDETYWPHQMTVAIIGDNVYGVLEKLYLVAQM